MLYRTIKPLFFRLDAEQAHELMTTGMRVAARVPLAEPLLAPWLRYDDPALRCECAGLSFANPIGLAAGFDKRGALVRPLSWLGFSHIEIGTITPRPQPGNDRPRLFRLPEDAALINRMGFNGEGMLAAAQQLRALQSWQGAHKPLVGVNIGKNRTTPLDRAVEDYTAAFVALAPLADYVAINISSPNTPALRKLHEREALAELLGALVTLNRKLLQPRPVFLKVSPDESASQLDDVLAVAVDSGVSGFIAGNTTLSRDGLQSDNRAESGGLSGAPLRARAREVIAYLYRATHGQLPVIGVGGVATAADAYGHIRAGASLVQLYTGMIYQGPTVVREICSGLCVLLRRDGFSCVAEAIGQP